MFHIKPDGIMTIASVSQRLGHSSMTTMLNIYTHAVQIANVKAMNVVANLIGEGL